MRTRNNVMILDTETVGDFGHPLVHDIGYVIIDRNFNVLKKARFLVKELHVHGQWILDTSDFYAGYKKDYAIARKHEMIKRWNAIANEIKADIHTYKVTTISAYNLAFDYRAINYTEKMFGEGKLTKILNQKSKSLLCIYNLACETILQTAEYHQFAEENKFISEAGNIKTSAECAYRYITQNAEYIEKHTALADAEDEMEILRYIVENVRGHKDMQYGLHYNCWKKAQ